MHKRRALHRELNQPCIVREIWVFADLRGTWNCCQYRSGLGVAGLALLWKNLHQIFGRAVCGFTSLIPIWVCLPLLWSYILFVTGEEQERSQAWLWREADPSTDSGVQPCIAPDICFGQPLKANEPFVFGTNHHISQPVGQTALKWCSEEPKPPADLPQASTELVRMSQYFVMLIGALILYSEG